MTELRSTPTWNPDTEEWEPNLGGGGGGSSPSTLTATVTTDANLFYVAHTFDLGHATAAYLKMTVLALTPDGETFGGGSDELTLDAIVGTGAPISAGISRDGVTFDDVVPQALNVTPVFAVAAVLDMMILVPRYLKVVATVDENFNLYAGANHPTGQVRFDVEYV